MDTYKISFSDGSMIFLPAKDSHEANIKGVQIANAQPEVSRWVVGVDEYEQA